MQATQVSIRWTPHDTAVYNASIGCGDSASDAAFVPGGHSAQSLQRFRAFPTLPLGLLHRDGPALLAPWRGSEQLKSLSAYVRFDARGLVHGDQAIWWNPAMGGEMPVAADAQVTHEVVGLFAKKTGVVITTRSTFTVPAGEKLTRRAVLVVSQASMFLRKGTLTPAGVSAASQLQAPSTPTTLPLEVATASRDLAKLMRVAAAPIATPSATETSSVTFRLAENQAMIYARNSDDNPLHVDYAVAKAVGFPAPILHGLCTYGFALRGLMRLLTRTDAAGGDVGRIVPLSCFARFTKPVFPGGTLRVELRGITRDGDRVTALFTVFASFPPAAANDSIAEYIACSHGAATFVIRDRSHL
jgi:acyl dehydratase